MGSAVKKAEVAKYPKRQGAPTLPAGISTPRKAMRLTQIEVAKKMGVTQGRVSEIEASDDAIQVSTLRAYAAAIGATLEVCITVDGQRIRVM